ncbi:putative late blight resistance proteinR1C-3 [Sesamum alatum]|uniref:Late blight resistance proteinR1C-3 n=1 Tax=Sesamum alatum TaxID=300844 RepID=A0AAE1YWW9_9LAMI|nr:putative late blight resistance proteinR1C-3 [Sesamum alatum]
MAAAAYAALGSLMHVLDQIQQYACRWLHINRGKIEILYQQVSFLQAFLERYSQSKSKEIEDLARQIAVVADEAQDIIECHVVDQLRDRFEDHRNHDMASLSFFCQDIDEIIEKLDSIKKDLMVVIEERTLQELKSSRTSVLASSSKLPPNVKNFVVGFDEDLVQIMEELTGYKDDLQIMSIVGMGGIGILNDLGVRGGQGNIESGENILSGKRLADCRDDELGERLYKRLFDERYLIVLDDVWSNEVWDDLKLFFPKNRRGSRIIVTTRQSSVAVSLGSQNPYLMSLLNKDQSWNLLCEKVFTKEGCPNPELEDIGKVIADGCGGLPLAIVVIGGLLAKSDMTREFWQFVAENVSSYANSGNDEHCLKILSLSYINLPIHLKPCFLYVGVLSKDHDIQVSKLIRLWVAEGFVNPVREKSLEEVAEEYLKDLVDRSLIMIRKLGCSGKIIRCGIHDLLRDLCVRESHRQRYTRIPRVQHVCFGEEQNVCFLCGDPSTQESIDNPLVLVGFRSSLAIPLVCNACRNTYPHLRLRLVKLKVIDKAYFPYGRECHAPTKLRYLAVKEGFRNWEEVPIRLKYVSPSTRPLLWNLQTLHLDFFIRRGYPLVLPCEIWDMPQLRHVVVRRAELPDPLMKDSIILENVQTVSYIRNFRWTVEVVERIPNLKKLKLYYANAFQDWSCYSLYNLAHLHKLESLFLLAEDFFTEKIAFPCSLKKLSLSWCRIPWESMTMIGLLPNLEVLKLMYHACEGSEWNPVEGGFCQLKVLSIRYVDLEWWRAENIHFPNLERLLLEQVFHLKEIPLGIGDIATLQSIDLSYCGDFVVNSAKQILEEQQSLGNETLQLHVNGERYQVGSS